MISRPSNNKGTRQNEQHMREIHLTAIFSAAAHAYKPGECNCVLRDFFFFFPFSRLPVLVA
jgi:hypothetical protein